MKKIFALLFALIMGAQGYSQQSGGNSTCETALPFCTGTTYQFPAGVNAGTGQPGPFYSCLLTRPNPAWYYMKVLNSGNIIINMHSVPSHDIDFCCWGPFPSQNACTQLTSSKVVSCSYSASSNETCTIPNGITGQYYILIITNYSNLPCNIIFSQTGGTGTTDCSILPPPCSSNSPICVAQTLQLTASSVTNANYHWSGPNNFVSTLQNPTILNAQPVNSGNYYLRITVNGTPSVDSTLTVVHVYKPQAHAGNDTSITNGVFTTLHGSATGGSGSYRYHWDDSTKFVDPNVQNPTTVNLFTSTLFKLTITDDSANCVSEDNVFVTIIGGALAVGAMATPSVICAGATTQIQALGSGGTGNYTYSWTGPGGFSSTLSNPTVQPTQTSTYTVTINDGYNSSTGSVTVTVNDPPLANAGINDTIPYGTYIYLNGSVPGGNHSYYYTWLPSDLLVNANLQYPQTTNLTSTTVYSLTVIDMVTNCVSVTPANVTIVVTGGALNTNPVATPGWICIGDTTQIHASAGGGNIGFYTYSWVSNPPGFTSSIPEPFVNPSQNTTYTVTVNDGYNSTTGSVPVNLYPQPHIYLGPPDSIVCVYSPVTLDAGNPGSSYLWSNGQNTAQISVSATGLTTETQSYSVNVTNTNGCVSTAVINVIFSFNACTGIKDKNLNASIKMYPNPSKGKFTIEMEGVKTAVNILVESVLGKPVANFVLPANSVGKSSILIDLIDLPKGFYLVKFESNNRIQTEKLVLE